MLLDNPIRLCRGAGNGKNAACLMTAVSMINGRPWERDAPSCVCPSITNFAVPTNDAMSDEQRQELYGDLPWEIIGTRTDPADQLRRSQVFMGLATQLHEEYVVNQMAIWHLIPSGFQNYMTHRDEAVGYGSVSDAANCIAMISHRLRAVGCLGEVEAIFVRCREAILQACAIGDRRPKEAVMTPAELSAALA